MSVLPRNRFFRHKNRRSKRRSTILGRIHGFFAALFSCFPCVSHPDAVESWTSTDVDEDDMIIRLVRRGDSLYRSMFDEDEMIPGYFDSESDTEEIPIEDILADAIRPGTRTLGPAPGEINHTDVRGHAFYGENLTRSSFVGGKEKGGAVDRAKQINSMRCLTTFKMPMKKLSYGQAADDMVVETDSLEELNCEDPSKANRLEVRFYQNNAVNFAPDSSFYCGKEVADDSEIEELQEVMTSSQQDYKENDGIPNNGRLDLHIEGASCFPAPILSLDATLLPIDGKNEGKLMSPEENMAIDRILLGDVEGTKQMAWEDANEKKKKKKENKVKKNKKTNTAVEEDCKNNVLGDLPPLPDTRYGIQMAWAENTLEENTRKPKEKKEQRKKKKKRGGVQSNDMTVGIKKSARKDGTSKQEDIDSKRNKKNQGKNLKEKNHDMFILEEVTENEVQDTNKGMQIEDDQRKIRCKEVMPDNNNALKEVESKGKEKKKKSRKSKKKKLEGIGHKIGKMLSEVLGEDASNENSNCKREDKKEKSKSKTMFSKNNRNSVSPVELQEHVVGESEDHDEQTESSQEADDFFHPRHRPTSKERPPCRGDPTKCGLFLIDIPVTPPEIVRNENGVGHCCQQCDYLAKLRQRELESMTPRSRAIAEEEDRNNPKQHEKCERRLEEERKKREADFQKRKKESSWATRALNAFKRDNNKRSSEFCETGRIIFVQPINQDVDDDLD